MKSKARNRIRRTTSSCQTYRPPALRAGTKRSRGWFDGRARTPPQQKRDGEKDHGDRVDGEDQGDAGPGDDDAGRRRTGRTREVDADDLEPGCRAEFVTGNKLGDDGQPRGQLDGRSDAQREGERQQQGGWHLVGGGEYDEGQPDDQEVALDGEHQPAPVERVREDAGRQSQQHHRECVGDLDEGDQRGRVGLVHEQPLRADGLHPGADQAGEDAEPDPAERGVPERRQRRRLSLHVPSVPLRVGPTRQRRRR